MNDGKISVKFLCEGLEEYHYLQKILSFPNIFSNLYYFPEPTNCKGITNIFPRYQDIFNKNIYDVILIFCDADSNSEDFRKLCSKIDNCMFGGNNVSSKIIIFSNPITLQIVLSHIDDVVLLSSSKPKNQNVVFNLTGISKYQGHKDQIEQMMTFVKLVSYQSMKTRLSKISTNINDLPSTNFLDFLNKLENDDLCWIDELNQLMK